ncbi:hypothetical protein [Desulfallas thermosapovorans]|uniref:Uncharacterized protein n=1 Tax=Desulfallas thermosapovorans DSM 6562 TaxID=1121431 RepID=A0A5S4ZVB3_9FIRM|nr:hypothetical protein [Desulfallas thermosapovorans]TYO96893.1 hypothetical protein LX24_00703 [Desulfallas thermosapovorans DSM 6562]
MSLKQRLFSIILILLFLWLIISVYFYGQHYLAYKSFPIWGKAETDDAFILLKNVVVYNHEQKYYDFDEIPWYWEIAKKISNNELRNAFVKVCYFYSRPYIFHKDKSTIKLQGIIALKGSKDPDDFLGINQPLDIRLYGDYDVSLTSGMGSRHRDGSNVLLFESMGNDVLLKNNHTYKAVIKNEQDEIIKELPLRPQWRYQAYSFFDARPFYYPFEPAITINRFINLLKDNQRELAASYIHFKCKETFPWENFDHPYFSEAHPGVEYYIGNYLGFENVFSMNLLYFKPGDQVRTPDQCFARQAIYFVDHLGKWKIINAEPIEIDDYN